MFGCRRFQRLLNKGRDGELSTREEVFLANHESRCAKCATIAEADLGLDMLRVDAFDGSFEASAMFTARVVEKVRIDRTKERISYWLPAMVGASVAAVAVMVMLQLFAKANTPGFTTSPVGEARLTQPASPPLFPNLDLPNRDR